MFVFRMCKHCDRKTTKRRWRKDWLNWPGGKTTTGMAAKIKEPAQNGIQTGTMVGYWKCIHFDKSK
jgi:hypothetical protein